MAVEHLVLFQWQPEATTAQVDAAIAALRDLADKVPSVLQLSCGENFSDRAKGYQCGLFVRFSDRAALAAYQAHPAHQAVVREHLKPIMADVLALDYEFET